MKYNKHKKKLKYRSKHKSRTWTEMQMKIKPGDWNGTIIRLGLYMQTGNWNHTCRPEP